MQPDGFILESEEITLDRSAYDRLLGLAEVARHAEVTAAKEAARRAVVAPADRAAAKTYVRKLSAAQTRAEVLKRKRAKAARKANRGSR